MFSAISPTLGTQPFNDWFAPDTVQRQPLGMTVTAVDPYWGTGKFVYIKSADAILKGSLVMWTEAYAGALLPSTAGQGFSFGVAMAPIPSGSYGWIQTEGFAVYKTNATVAADTAVAVAAAGIAGTLANGKQLLNTRNRISATGTKTVVAATMLGSAKVVCASGYDGFFIGMALSGTGIPASTVVAALDPDGRTIYTGSAIGTTGDKNSTATGSITLTGTYTGYGAAIINNPIAQGQVV
jgi:predicted RecA/RadA family phage recombinase